MSKSHLKQPHYHRQSKKHRKPAVPIHEPAKPSPLVNPEDVQRIAMPVVPSEPIVYGGTMTETPPEESPDIERSLVLKDRSPVVIFWIVAIIVVVCLLLASRCHAQTNSLVIYDSQGHPLYTVSLTMQIMGVLTTMAGFAWLAKILLRFLPAAKDGTFMSWVVGAVKVIGGSTPEKHQADVSVTAPTPNGLDPGLPLSPKTPVEVPVSQQPTPNGL